MHYYKHVRVCVDMCIYTYKRACVYTYIRTCLIICTGSPPWLVCEFPCIQVLAADSRAFSPMPGAPTPGGPVGPWAWPQAFYAQSLSWAGCFKLVVLSQWPDGQFLGGCKDYTGFGRRLRRL